jgi:hypothetical protein
MLLLLTLHPEWDATLGRNHTIPNASKNLGSGAISKAVIASKAKQSIGLQLKVFSE